MRGWFGFLLSFLVNQYLMDTNSLAPKVAAATLASAHAGNRNLSTASKRMAVGQTEIRECVPFLINHDNVI